jgi:hypothetical protein
MTSFPLFVVGSPRTGTIFLCSVLNVHPLIQLTNECRVFELPKDNAGDRQPSAGPVESRLPRTL